MILCSVGTHTWAARVCTQEHTHTQNKHSLKRNTKLKTMQKSVRLGLQMCEEHLSYMGKVHVLAPEPRKQTSQKDEDL